jgi:predicted RNA-binding Zn-ribbon protein involved in translation (DUF1610 family)
VISQTEQPSRQTCPHCEQQNISKNGRDRRGTQVYRCADCGRSFTALTGIESTHEQAIRRCGLRWCRYLGSAKAHLQHLVTAAAINLLRIADWWEGKAPAQTRHSRFASLQPAMA